MEHSPSQDYSHPSSYKFPCHLQNPEALCSAPYPAQAELNI